MKMLNHASTIDSDTGTVEGKAFQASSYSTHTVQSTHESGFPWVAHCWRMFNTLRNPPWASGTQIRQLNKHLLHHLTPSHCPDFTIVYTRPRENGELRNPTLHLIQTCNVGRYNHHRSEKHKHGFRDCRPNTTQANRGPSET